MNRIFLMLCIALFSAALIGCPDDSGDTQEGEPTQQANVDLEKLTPEARITYELCRFSEEDRECRATPENPTAAHQHCKQYMRYNFTDKCSEEDRDVYMRCFQKWKNEKKCWVNFKTPFADCVGYKQISFDCLYSIQTPEDEYPDPQYKLEDSERMATPKQAADAFCTKVLGKCSYTQWEGDKDKCIEQSIEVNEYYMIVSEQQRKEYEALGIDPEKYGKCTEEEIAKVIDCSRKYKTTCDFDQNKWLKDPHNEELRKERLEIMNQRIREDNMAEQCIQNELSDACLFKLGRTKGYNKSLIDPDAE